MVPASNEFDHSFTPEGNIIGPSEALSSRLRRGTTQCKLQLALSIVVVACKSHIAEVRVN